MPPKVDGISPVYLQGCKMKIGFTQHIRAETDDIASSVVNILDRRVILHATRKRRQLSANVFKCSERIVASSVRIREDIADRSVVCNNNGVYGNGLGVGYRNHDAFLLSYNIYWPINVPFFVLYV